MKGLVSTIYVRPHIHTNGMGTSPKSLRVHPCSFSHDSETHQGIEYSPPCP